MASGQQIIAKELGISVATVSRSLRNDPLISPETRGRVLETATRLGYQPCRRPIRVRSTATMTIGAFVRDSNTEGAGLQPHPMIAAMLAGISDVCGGSNVSVNVHFIRGTDEAAAGILTPQGQPPALRERQLRGLILMFAMGEQLTKGLSALLPAVSVVHHFPGQLADCVDADLSDGFGKLVLHLRRLGHRRIGFVAPERKFSWVWARFGGFAEAMARFSLPLDPAAVLNLASTDTLEQAQQAVIRKSRDGVTAWVCPQDDFAASICVALRQAGLSVPKDVSVTGFDGFAHPLPGERITTLRMPFEELGAAAARTLLDRLSHPARPPRRLCIQSELVEGETTGPCPGF